MGKSKKKIHDARSQKIGRKKKKKRTGYKYIKQITFLPKIDMEECVREAPEEFSFITNLEETVKYFSVTINELKHGGFKKHFMLDSSKVTFVTTDVIMYLIALMKNVRANKMKQYTFIGNYPKNMAAKKIYEESGIHNFVKSKSKRLPPNTEKVQIISGNNNSTEDARKMCEFVMQKLSVDRIYTQQLYSLLLEMMSNVYFHAYTNDELMKPVWYMYAEYTNNCVRFIFVDTGMSIARTVRRNSIYEKVVKKLNIDNDSKLIKSAFDGAFRTSTDMPNRGRGLPSFKEFAKSDKCKDFRVISGSGFCKMSDDKQYFEKTELNNKIYGTIYIFTFM